MKRIISYIFLCCLLWVGCTSTTEGLAPDEVITVSNNKIEMGSKGGKTSIKVDSYCDWQVTSDEEWQWISVSNKSGKKGITTLDITLNENITTSNRSAVLTLANDMYGVSQQINITQSNSDAFINISDSRYEVSSIGAIKSIDVESNTTWTTSCDADWITLSPTNGDGSSTLQITIKPNTTTEIRETTVKVANKEHNITKEIAIKQAAFSPELTVDVSSLDFSCLLQEKSITVDANISWTASCDANWITISPQSGKEGKSSVKITVEQNTNTTSRSTTVKISNKEYNITKEVSITQDAFTPQLTVDVSSLDFSCNKQEKSITIDANISWTASCNADWITLTPQSGESGKMTMRIAVAANTKSEERTATIIVKGKSNFSNIEKLITVVQQRKESYFRAGSYTWAFDLLFSETDTYPITTSTVFTQNGAFDLSTVLGSEYAGRTAIDWNIKGFMGEIGLLEETSPTTKAFSYVMVGDVDAYEILLFADRSTGGHSSIGTTTMQDENGNKVIVELFLGDLASAYLLQHFSLAAFSESEIYSNNGQPVIFYKYEGNQYLYAYMNDLSIAPATANSPMRVKASVGERATVVGQGTPLKVNPISLRK